MKKNTSKTIIIGILSGGITALIVSSVFINSILPTNTSSENFWGNFIPSVTISQEDSVVRAVKKSAPAVVSVIITKDVPILEEYYEDFYSSPFDNSFGGGGFNFQIPKYRESGETETIEIGGGSGFIVSPDGYIVTNKHVAEDEDADYTIFTNDGEEYSAKIIARDSVNDIAILKIEGEDFPYLEFGDSDNLEIGQTVIAIGNPLLEFDNSVSVGVVSGLSRSITASDQYYGKTEQLEGVIQTDAAINPGNSGGPLLNLNGEVIGVNVAVADGENIGFSLPANPIKKIVDSVKEHGRIIKPYLGIRYVPVTEGLKNANNLSVDYGVLVTRGETIEDLAVIPGSPADKAGIVENDIILEIDGEKLELDASLAKIIAEKNVGNTISLKILHKGEEKEIEVTLEENPE